MKVKTVYTQYPRQFDLEVNRLLEEGWKLKKTKVILQKTNNDVYFYALLKLKEEHDDEN